MNAPAIFESKPRWPGAAQICIFENLPAFATERALNSFNATCGSRPIVEKWECQKCGCWHAILQPQAPAGDSSGGARTFSHNIPQYRRETKPLPPDLHRERQDSPLPTTNYALK